MQHLVPARSVVEEAHVFVAQDVIHFEVFDLPTSIQNPVSRVRLRLAKCSWHTSKCAHVLCSHEIHFTSWQASKDVMKTLVYVLGLASLWVEALNFHKVP
eukprot:352865-Chlamydomonas_euryale.AAC.9